MDVQLVVRFLSEIFRKSTVDLLTDFSSVKLNWENRTTKVHLLYLPIFGSGICFENYLALTFILANIHIVESLPKTRSGKVMRRLLRKLANDETDYGDTTTLLDPTVLASIRSVVQSDK